MSALNLSGKGEPSHQHARTPSQWSEATAVTSRDSSATASPEQLHKAMKDFSLEDEDFSPPIEVSSRQQLQRQLSELERRAVDELSPRMTIQFRAALGDETEIEAMLGERYKVSWRSGRVAVVTCPSSPHETSVVNLCSLIADALKKLNIGMTMVRQRGSAAILLPSGSTRSPDGSFIPASSTSKPSVVLEVLHSQSVEDIDDMKSEYLSVPEIFLVLFLTIKKNQQRVLSLELSALIRHVSRQPHRWKPLKITKDGCNSVTCSSADPITPLPNLILPLRAFLTTGDVERAKKLTIGQKSTLNLDFATMNILVPGEELQELF